MPGSDEVLIPARWSEDARGVPRSPLYGDVYHSAAGALPQARHVFLRGNRLPERWQGREAFTVCETGFGLGRNFLATWQAWREDSGRSARLHYVAFEAHPFPASDLRRGCEQLPPELRPLTDALLARWPALLPGLHRIELEDGSVTLTLAFGRIERLACQVQARVDAFYLDGFSPRVNPAMWSPRVFGQMRRLAVAGATVATWCAAGQVRRDLQDAGFLVSRVPGFAAKRDMTVAVLRPGLGGSRGASVAQRVAVVGGGLAGAGIAQALALRGDSVELWEESEPEAMGGGGPAWAAGALVPAFSPDDDTRSRLSRAGLERAWARWMALAPEARPDPCGALVCARDPEQMRAQQTALARLQFPSEWVCWLDADQAQDPSGMSTLWGGLWFPRALHVVFATLLSALRATPGVACRRARVASLRQGRSGLWELCDAQGRVLGAAPHVVIANGRGALPLVEGVVSSGDWPVLRGATPIAGQLSLYHAEDAEARVPRCILSGKGYCLPPRAGWGVAGSTYRPSVDASVADDAGHREILARLAGWLPPRAVPWVGRGQPQGWAGWRVATRDHLPVVGPVPGGAGLWLACAYGSRGLSWSALAGDLIAAQLHGEPLPLERELLRRIRIR
ncbi:tRNA 5-methylaminomethyl-2-thiouridine biosynthesis bifunctional protein MnmC OS=Castellaniella defragrans OX=75697 GN=mnmC PE=3 SV=1 [Castellaniella defragrans]